MRQLIGRAFLVVGITTGMPLSILAQHDHGSGGMSMPMPSAPASRAGKLPGILVSREETSITIEAKRKGDPTTFMIDGQTRFKGDVQAGAEIIVKYQEQAGGMQKATSVEAKKGSAKHSQ